MSDSQVTELHVRVAGLRLIGRDVEAGRLLFESVPPSDRPAWAARVLRTVMDSLSVELPELREVLDVADDRARWPDVHRAFDALRRRPEDSEWSQEQYVVSIGELVAKVTYNATNPHDEFDEDSGWWIAKLVWDVLSRHQPAASISQRMEEVLYSHLRTDPNLRA